MSERKSLSGLIVVAVLTAIMLMTMACGGGGSKLAGLYTVRFYTNGGTPVPETQHIGMGGLVEKPPVDPAFTGKTFSGWYRDSEQSEKWDFAKDTVIRRSRYGLIPRGLPRLKAEV